MWTCPLNARPPYVTLLMLITSFKGLWRMKNYFLNVPKPQNIKISPRNAASMCNTDGCEPDCLWFHRHCDSSQCQDTYSECRTVGRPYTFSVCHVISDCRDDSADRRAQRWVWTLGPRGWSSFTTPSSSPSPIPGAHARQAVRSDITTSGPWAVFGTQADVFYETPLWEKLINSQFMADEFVETQYWSATLAL